MGALGLADPPTPHSGNELATVIGRLTALQGQDWYSSLWALGVRAPSVTRAQVYDALNAGTIVRSWPMRGTLHLVNAQDLGWIQHLTERSVLAGAPKRRAYLGIDNSMLARVIDATTAALADGMALSRDGLAEAWRVAGVEVTGQQRYHLLWYMSQTRIIVQGPVAPPDEVGRTPEPLFVLVSQWIRAPRAFAGDAALAELAVRFTRGRGVVQAQDLAWWAGIPKRDATRGLEIARADDRLVPVTVEGLNYWAEPQALTPGTSQTGSGTLLLPAFDEHLLGYKDRRVQLDPELFERVVPGRNGMFRATVVRDGRVVGLWRAKQLKTRTSIEVEPFPGVQIDAEALGSSAGRWARFHSAREPEITAK